MGLRFAGQFAIVAYKGAHEYAKVLNDPCRYQNAKCCFKTIGTCHCHSHSWTKPHIGILELRPPKSGYFSETKHQSEQIWAILGRIKKFTLTQPHLLQYVLHLLSDLALTLITFFQVAR